MLSTEESHPAAEPPPGDSRVVVVGAGPAGLTAAYELLRKGIRPLVLEASDQIGGISTTVERDGWRFDLGGHRFYTKVRRVEAFWKEILGPEDLLERQRLSRIYYGGKFFDYPIKPLAALATLGPVEATRSVGSYLWARVHPPRSQDTFETWTAARFGWRLYRTFFKTYTEKVWGMPANTIQADWAAQRIKNLSLGTALSNALFPKRAEGRVTSLIERFLYPRLGPGMMWERTAELVRSAGGTIVLSSPLLSIARSSAGAETVTFAGPDGEQTVEADHIISSMPLSALVLSMRPEPPEEVLAAAGALRHRDFLTVALVVPQSEGFPDNWIYVHDPGVKLGRVQNFGAWSADMVMPGRTCLGLEYFVTRGDELWTAEDDELIRMGTAELESIGLIRPGVVEKGYVVRVPMAYPVYDPGYASRVDLIRKWLDANVPNVQPVGRNGMHRYNNQDHSMYTAMLAVENILGAHHDAWSVNVEAEYLEQGGTQGSPAGTGRTAPLIAPAKT